ncbi:MAG: acetolactate decarboxylase [Peptococcaceae bacterium]|jgi:acetolactate decarboxylase|nr:acetolactate decarboxylase [Peptococcaceae bacterium]
MRKIIFYILGVVICLGAWSLYRYSAKEGAIFYQGGTYAALYAGNYNQMASVGQIKEKGDFGLGVFDLLDGEMMVLDGEVYQMTSDGRVAKVKRDAGTPFYMMTAFHADSEKELVAIDNFSQLCQILDGYRKRDDVIYGVKISGSFSYIKTAAFARQYYPYPTLAEAAKEQAVFTYENVSGTLIGFWLPDCTGTMNLPGYHFHFLSDDRQQGGHVLEVQLVDGLVQFDEIVEMNIALSGVMTVPLSDGGSVPVLVTR